MKVGDLVYVPNAYSTSWEPYLTRIDGIDENYHCIVKRKNLSSFDGGDIEYLAEFSPSEVFATWKECNEYIASRYYCALCEKCSYHKDSGTILRCRQCKNAVKVENDSPSGWDKYYCKFTGVLVGTQASATASPEICKNFSSLLPQYKDWDYERYENLLKNCEFNPGCVFHKKSVHRTCDFEHYMNEFVLIPVSAELEGRQVKYAMVRRYEWVDQSYCVKNGILCWGVKFAPEITKTGKVKKGTVNNTKMFEERKELK